MKHLRNILAALMVMVPAMLIASASTTDAAIPLPQFGTLGLLGSSPIAPSPVALIDTGVDAAGPILAGRVIVRQGTGTDSASSHGSFMAAAITGQWDTGLMTYTGSAPGARVDFFDCANGPGIDVYCAEGALRASVTLGVRVVNMSFATNVPIPDDLMGRYLADMQLAEASGVTVVASSGDGPGLSFPASLPGVISVSSIAANGTKVNPAAMTSAPGRNLVIVDANGTYLSGSGSSFAAAYTSGVIARLIAKRPNLTPNDLRSLVGGHVNLTRMEGAVGVTPYHIAAPRCVTVTRPVRGSRVIRFTAVPHVTYYRVRVGGLSVVRRVGPFRTRLAGGVSVQSIGQYGTFSTARVARGPRC